LAHTQHLAALGYDRDLDVKAAQLLLFSADNQDALERITARVAAHLRAHPEQPLADLAFTLRARLEGRLRRMLVCTSVADALDALDGRDPAGEAGERPPPVVCAGQPPGRHGQDRLRRLVRAVVHHA
jgi:acyl transferase domain-containing protein